MVWTLKTTIRFIIRTSRGDRVFSNCHKDLDSSRNFGVPARIRVNMLTSSEVSRQQCLLFLGFFCDVRCSQEPIAFQHFSFLWLADCALVTLKPSSSPPTSVSAYLLSPGARKLRGRFQSGRSHRFLFPFETNQARNQ